ncbi:hypothetical protein MIR68_001157 [Amoeboaphelidium protococcarum]|nr:hypothetical protein MIR68_001157 [Amoeboaphelidium protococcarum]
MTEFFCPFYTKSTKIKKGKFVYHLTGRLWQLDGWMVKRLMCETTKSPYDPLLLINYCKRTNTVQVINASGQHMTQLKIEFDADYWRRVREKSANPRQDGNKYKFVWYFSMRKHRQNYQTKAMHLLGDAECFHCAKFTHKTSMRYTRSALSELAGTSDSVSTASKSSLVPCYQSFRPLTVDGANPIAPAKLKECSILRLFVNAANLEKLVMYFRRLGTKAAETKLREWKKHSLMNNILRILFEFSLTQSYGVRNASDL